MCVKHPTRVTLVRNAADFSGCSGGGCALPCDLRLECGHACAQMCHHDGHEHYRCGGRCERKRGCGHPCPLRCWRPCGDCAVPVPKKLPHCNHTPVLPCASDVTEVVCTEPCQRVWTGCGHTCTATCGDRCPSTCRALVQRVVPSCPKRHTAAVECGGGAPPLCVSPCLTPLPCGHTCAGTCGGCRAGAAHAPCSQPCTRLSLCGHPCIVKHPCREPCPPCQRPCETRCEHSRCQQPCSAPCAPCVEPCRVGCPHQTCPRLCGAPCSVDKCDVPCGKKIGCGHECIGLCGEVCPTKCRVCDSGALDTLTQETLGEVDPGVRFIQLTDCGHVFNAEGLDTWMQTQDVEGGGAGGPPKAIALPVCPECRAPIRRSFRYAAIVRKALGEIDRLKRRTYAGPELRGVVLSALGRGVKPLRAAITSLEARILEYPLSATAHVLRGELYTNLATAAADPEPALLLADASFVEALRLLGRTETGAPTPGGVMCAPALTPRQAAHEVYIALLGLARRLVREAKLDAAKVRLDAAADAAGTAGLPTLDVTAALIDVRRGDAAAKAAAKTAVEGLPQPEGVCFRGVRGELGRRKGEGLTQPTQSNPRNWRRLSCSACVTSCEDTKRALLQGSQSVTRTHG